MGYPFIFPCTVCSTPHTRILPNKKSAVTALTSGTKLAFCSTECRQSWHKQNRRTAICCTCSKPFYQKQASMKFCTRKCYLLDMQNNPANYDLTRKAKYASSFSNTPESIEKGLHTKLERGTIIDWTDASWKQFWRKCNELTRKKRSELIENWDGYDYIDGEYIKDFLKLHYSHKDYPTLDHVVPRSAFYKQGKTPQEACEVTNLKWTKRSNNSRKYNK